MFLAMGLITVIVGVATFFFIPDTPMKATFLSDDEKISILKHVSVNQTGIHNTKFNYKHIIESVIDPQVWLLTLQVVLVSSSLPNLLNPPTVPSPPSQHIHLLISAQQSVSSGVVTTYSSTLIRSFGFSGPVSALLNTPSGIVSIFFTLLVGIGIRKASNRWAWVFMCCIPGIIGGGLMSFLPKDNRAGVLIGIYLVNSIVAPLPVIYHWTAANCAGYTKRAFSSALVAGSFSIGNIIGPQTFQARDAPEYRPAKVAVLATQAAAGVLAIVLWQYYVWENKRRDRAQAGRPQEGETANDETAWVGLTDKENKKFRYVY